MRKLLTLLICFGVASIALAEPKEINGRRYQVYPTKDRAAKQFARGGHGASLSYHGGPVIHSARVVAIFWGADWGTGGSDSTTAADIRSFFNQFGGTGEYNVITQYSDGSGHIMPATLGNAAYFDGSTPPTNVTDAAVQGEVLKYLSQNGVTFDSSTIYEVFLPKESYASLGSSDSCGGPSLAFCAYHGSFSNGGRDIKYSSMPYPSCGGCQWSGWSVSQNYDHFACHETREAVTDEDLNAWYDNSGNEADDKCAWSPAPFLDNGFGYQYEWSNSARGCVQKQ
jgi:hypothetical protein